jgi:hypothetical protein
MSITIQCPDCHTPLRANKTPPPGKLMECLFCGYRFTFAEATRPRLAVAPPVVPPTASYGATMMAGVVVGSVLVLALLVAGIVGIYHATRPTIEAMAVTEEPPPPKTPEHKQTPKVVAKAEPKVEPKVEPKSDPKAEPSIDLKLESDRELFTHLMIDGGIAIQLKKFDQAIDAYTRALQLMPNRAEVAVKLAEAKAGLEVQEKAKREQEQLAADAAALVKRGQAALEKEQFVAAIEFFKLALQKSPANGTPPTRSSPPRIGCRRRMRARRSSKISTSTSSTARRR